MTPCSLPNQPRLMSASSFAFDVSEIERRFLRGWWTRGVLPADQFVTTNWAGLIIPDKIEFTASEIIITYAGRWWGDPNCPSTLPKVVCTITGICHRGRAQIHTKVNYGKKVVMSLYIGHNGRNKLDAVPLEDLSFEDPCSIPRQAGIPEEKSNTIEIEHFLDWINACITNGSEVIGAPGDFWVNAFAEYLDRDFRFQPCIGCEYPIDYSTKPNILVGKWYEDIAGLATKTILELFGAVTTGTIPTTVAVPICPNSFWLDMTLPDLKAQAHVRQFDVCGGLEDSVYLFDVGPSQLLNCFITPEPDNWPAREDPKWQPTCEPQPTRRCNLTFNTKYDELPPGQTNRPAQAFQQAFHTHKTFYFTPGFSPWREGSGDGAIYTIVGLRTITERFNVWDSYTFYGYDGPVPGEGCVTMTVQSSQIVLEERASGRTVGTRINQLYAQNRGNCEGPIDSSGGPGNPGPPPPPPIGDPLGDPQGDGDCFIEGEIAYAINISTVLGSFSFRASKSFRAKIPRNVSLGAINMSTSGNTLNISAPLLGNYAVDLTSAIAHYNSYSATVTSLVPVSFGLQNLRRLCP